MTPEQQERARTAREAVRWARSSGGAGAAAVTAQAAATDVHVIHEVERNPEAYETDDETTTEEERRQLTHDGSEMEDDGLVGFPFRDGERRRWRGTGKRQRGSLIRGLPTDAIRLKPARRPAYITAARQRALRRYGQGFRPLPAFRFRILPLPSGPVADTDAAARGARGPTPVTAPPAKPVSCKGRKTNYATRPV